MKKRLERLELESRKRREKRTTTLDAHALASALTVALRDYPEELAEMLARLSSGRLGDAKDVLEHLATGKEDDYILTPRAVGGSSTYSCVALTTRARTSRTGYVSPSPNTQTARTFKRL